MSEYFIYYSESQIICLIIFAIMLAHNLLNVDRQEKQVKYDHTLIAFMLYFASDMLWAAVIANVLPKTHFTLVVPNILNFVFLAYITYSWLQYALAVQQAPNRNLPVIRFAISFPLVVSFAALTMLFLVSPGRLIDDKGNLTILYFAFLVLVPVIYIAASVLYAVRRAGSEKNPTLRRQYYYVGLFPLVVVFGGLLQLVVLPDTPIFCYSCTILMLIFYIESMEDQISLDPLTGLNNRGQLHRFISQESSLFREGLKTYVIMIDVNDFKLINDNYGHAEGDRALVIIGNSLRHAAGSAGFPVFISRYGGDEFVVIINCKNDKAPETLRDTIRARIQDNSNAAGIPYAISIAYGYDELSPYGETFDDCLKRADEKSYKDKETQKSLSKNSNQAVIIQ